MSFVCITSNKTWKTIPEGAVQLTSGGSGHRRVISYRLLDGTVHHLRPAMSLERKHKQWHRNGKKLLACPFCYPPPKDAQAAQVGQRMSVAE
jgi:hypothetical protein